MISNNNNMLSYVIGREERLALKDRSSTADKEHSWFGPTIRLSPSLSRMVKLPG